MQVKPGDQEEREGLTGEMKDVEATEVETEEAAAREERADAGKAPVTVSPAGGGGAKRRGWILNF